MRGYTIVVVLYLLCFAAIFALRRRFIVYGQLFDLFDIVHFFQSWWDAGAMTAAGRLDFSHLLLGAFFYFVYLAFSLIDFSRIVEAFRYLNRHRGRADPELFYLRSSRAFGSFLTHSLTFTVFLFATGAPFDWGSGLILVISSLYFLGSRGFYEFKTLRESNEWKIGEFLLRLIPLASAYLVMAAIVCFGSEPYLVYGYDAVRVNTLAEAVLSDSSRIAALTVWGGLFRSAGLGVAMWYVRDYMINYALPNIAPRHHVAENWPIAATFLGLNAISILFFYFAGTVYVPTMNALSDVFAVLLIFACVIIRFYAQRSLRLRS